MGTSKRLERREPFCGAAVAGSVVLGATWLIVRVLSIALRTGRLRTITLHARPFRFPVFGGGVDQHDDGVANVLWQVRPAVVDVAQRLVAVSRCRLVTIFAAGALPMRYQGIFAVS